MAGGEARASLQVLFGKAFLAELRRGDVETAKVFARAFLLTTPAVPIRAELMLPVAA